MKLRVPHRGSLKVLARRKFCTQLPFLKIVQDLKVPGRQSRLRKFALCLPTVESKNFGPSRYFLGFWHLDRRRGGARIGPDASYTSRPWFAALSGETPAKAWCKSAWMWAAATLFRLRCSLDPLRKGAFLTIYTHKI